MTQTTPERTKRDLPLWVGILLIAIGVIAAGAFIWSQVAGYWSGPSGVFTIEGVDPSAPPQRAPGRGQPRPQVNIREMSETSWRARTPAYTVDAARSADGKLTVTMSASTVRVLPQDAQWVLVARNRLTPAVGRQMGLSDQQVRQFRALPTAIRHQLTLNDAQSQQLTGAFDKWLKSAGQERTAAEGDLATAINQVGQAALPALAQRLQGQYDQFKKSVTDEQWRKLRELAATAPATAPAN